MELGEKEQIKKKKRSGQINFIQSTCSFTFLEIKKNLLSQMNDVFYVPDPICSVCHSVKLTERQKHERSELDARTFEIQGETVSNNRQTESRSLLYVLFSFPLRLSGDKFGTV